MGAVRFNAGRATICHPLHARWAGLVNQAGVAPAQDGYSGLPAIGLPANGLRGAPAGSPGILLGYGLPAMTLASGSLLRSGIRASKPCGLNSSALICAANA